jgi:hypothetical protein
MAKKTATKTKTFDPNRPPAYINQANVDIPEEDGGNRFPMVKLLQALSPEVDPDDDKYYKGATQGDIIITDGTNHILIDGKKGFNFVPISVRKQWVEWVPRGQGGGFVASYNSKEEMEIGFTEGNEVVVSIDYLILSTDIDPDGGITPALLQFNSPTKMAKAKEMRSHIQQYKTMEGVTYNLSGTGQKNRAGQKFFNFKIDPVGWTNKQLMGEISQLIEDYTPLFLPESDEIPF